MATYSFDEINNINAIAYYNASEDNITQIANRAVVSAFDLFRDDATVGDWISFAWVASVWHDLTLTIDISLAASSITIVWEYIDQNGIWQPLPNVVDGTNNFIQSGTITFDVPDEWESVWWRYAPINMGYGAFIRARITAISGLTEGGHCNAAAQLKDYAIHCIGEDVTPEDIYEADQTNSWGYITKIDNTYLADCNIYLGDGTNATILTIDGFIELIIGKTTAPRNLFGSYGIDNLIIGNESGGNSILKHFGNEKAKNDPYLGYFNATMTSYTSFVLWNNGCTIYRILNLYGGIFIINGGYSVYGGGGIWDGVSFGEFSGNGWLYIYGKPTINSMDLGNFGGILSYHGNTFRNIDFSGGKLLWAYLAEKYTLINCILDDPISTVKGRLAGSTTDIKYTLDLVVKDSLNNPISGQPIIIKDKDGNILASLTTDANGEISQQELLFYNVTGKEGSETLITYIPITVEVGDNTTYRKETYTLDEDKAYDVEAVIDYVALEISSLSFTNCSNEVSNDGIIAVQAQGGSGNYEYSKDGGINWQTSGSFTDLILGDYIVKAKDTTTGNEIEAGTMTIVPLKKVRVNVDQEVLI